MPRAAQLVSVLAIALLPPSAILASTAPTTPTFVQAWGANGPGRGQFSDPVGVVTDALGNVYVSDFIGDRIQKFDRLGNFVLEWGTFGNGNGEFYAPVGIAVDGAGNLYVADSYNHRIEKFSSTGAFLLTWGTFGTGNGQFSQPYGVAVDGAGSVYVADLNNNRVQKFTSNGVYLTQWGSSGSANGQFTYPTSVAIGPAGEVYVVDALNARVQKFTAAGTYLAQWGTPGSGDGQFGTPVGLTVDAAGNVYVTDQGNDRVQKFSSAGTFLTQWWLGGSAYPFGIAADAEANLYLADQGAYRITKWSSAGAGPPAEPPSAFWIKWGTQGPGNGQFFYPTGAVTDASGNVYVADYSNHRIQKFSSTGAYLSQWGTFGGGNGQFRYPADVAVDPAGNVFVADETNHRIQKFSSSGTYLAQWGSFGTGPGQFNVPEGIATDAAGNVYVADTGNSRVQKFTNGGVFMLEFGSNGSGFGQFGSTGDVAVDPAGYVYVTDVANGRLQKFTSSGSFVQVFGSPPFLSQPRGVATDAIGNVFVADRFNQRIMRYASSGVFLSSWGTFGTGDGQLSYPWGVAVDPAGNVYVVDNDSHRIQKFATPPSIALISDVKNDQGRQARLRILRCSADVASSGVPVLRYDVFRRIDALPGGSATAAASDPSQIQLAGWEQVASISAFGDPEYNVVVPTLVDATSASLEYSAFLVRAATAVPTTYAESSLENGFSIDNLPPPTPAPLTAAYTSGATHLQWGASPAADLAGYRIYRGTSADFIPGPGNLIATPAETWSTDPGPAGRFYKLSAVDFNGNESPFAFVGPQQTTDVPQAKAEFALEGIRPNPSPGAGLAVHFSLANRDAATLSVVDVAGRRVLRREVGDLGPGPHVVALAGERRWTPGVYFVRLTQGAKTRIARAVVVD